MILLYNIYFNNKSEAEKKDKLHNCFYKYL